MAAALGSPAATVGSPPSTLGSPPAVRRLITCAGGPEVRLLDARPAGLDEQALRAAARSWPEARRARCSSRSYRHPYALIAWHGSSVGVDVERIERCDAAFARSICTPSETVEWESLPDPDEHFSSMWSSKEAVAKALGDALSYDPRRLQAPMLWPDGRAGGWRSMRLQVAEGHLGWVCWRCAAA